jgi:hypothetical protein
MKEDRKVRRNAEGVGTSSETSEVIINALCYTHIMFRLTSLMRLLKQLTSRDAALNCSSWTSVPFHTHAYPYYPSLRHYQAAGALQQHLRPLLITTLPYMTPAFP